MTYQTQIEDWRADRLAALKAEDGWLNLTDRIEIATAHGLYCDGASIILDLQVESPRLGREGNVLRLDDGGRISTLGAIEAAGMAGIRPVLSSRPSLTHNRSAP